MRNKSFVPDDALHLAMLRFWEKGYEATSMQDLQDAMGIKRQSLYDTFGSKHELFMSSLRYYHEHVIGRNLSKLNTDPSPKKAIHNYFNQRLKDIDDPKVIKGCLLTNSATEIGLWEEDVKAQIKNMLEDMEDRFSTAIQRAQDLGEVSFDKDAKLLAIQLVNNAQGLFVMAKSGMSRNKLNKLVEQFLTVLD